MQFLRASCAHRCCGVVCEWDKHRMTRRCRSGGPASVRSYPPARRAIDARTGRENTFRDRCESGSLVFLFRQDDIDFQYIAVILLVELDLDGILVDRNILGNDLEQFPLQGREEIAVAGIVAAFMGNENREPVFGNGGGGVFLFFAKKSGKERHVTSLRTGASSGPVCHSSQSALGAPPQENAPPRQDRLHPRRCP